MADSRHQQWMNCCDLEDPRFLSDEERIAIDAMQEAIEPLDDNTAGIRQRITRFESCYHEADKEADIIIKAIGSGQCPAESNERPIQRKKELQDAASILIAWTQLMPPEAYAPAVGNISADKLHSFLGRRTPLKLWQVQRIIDRIGHTLDPDAPWHNLALGVAGDGPSQGNPAEQPYQDTPKFLQQTRKTIIHDTVAGQKAEISLAMAIDLLMPCHWDFVGALCTTLKAIDGQLHPAEPLTCCSRNLHLNPLYDRLKIISETLDFYWRYTAAPIRKDPRILASLGPLTPVKRWLAASFDKTIRYQLAGEFPLSLI